jgi:predicted PurR-regulated permease PerM
MNDSRNEDANSAQRDRPSVIAGLGDAAGVPAPRPADTRLRHYAQVAAVVTLVACCALVLRPFVPALLFAAVVCLATWPLYVRLLARLGGRAALAALIMTLALIVLVIGPTVLLALSLADNVTALAESVRVVLHGGAIAPPAWLGRVPIAGDLLVEYWKRIATSGDSVLSQARGLLVPARDFLIGAGKAAGDGLLQIMLASFVGFFFYRDGDALMLALRAALEKIAGPSGEDLLDTMASTVKGVVHGIFGTAFAQALVALVGFLIAGVPAPFFLAVATFVLSILPIGPPLVWGGAALWLLFSGQTGWAVFMAVYGLVCISTIDNVIKPYIISRSSDLPLLLTVLGVLGGVIAFGFIGLFIGPPVLAIGLAVLKLWIERRAGEGRLRLEQAQR